MQTYFWSLLLCKNLFFRGREVMTGNTSAVRRLPYIQSRFCKKGLFLCQMKWMVKSIKFCELSPSTCFPPLWAWHPNPSPPPMIESAWQQSPGLTMKYSGDILGIISLVLVKHWSYIMCQTRCSLGLGCGCLAYLLFFPPWTIAGTSKHHQT